MRGFAFTLDAILSFLMAIQIFILINSAFSSSGYNPYFDLKTRAVAGDVLRVIESENRAGNYFSMSDSEIENDLFFILNMTLPDHYGARLELDLYQYTDPDFTPVKQINISTSAPKNGVISVERILKPDSGYGIVRLSLWAD